jgi:hypothetical protein
VFTVRRNSIVVPLNENEIAILGGCGVINGYLFDVIVFNVTSKQCRKVADAGDKNFDSFDN